MEARYERNIPALTAAECLALRTKRVLVVGCGGLGGHIIDQLARIGVGTIRAVDGDVFEETNLNRQLLSSVPLLGVNKAKAAADHIGRVNPAVTVEAVDIKAVYKKMLDYGATSFWETELGWVDFSKAGSLCHGWSASPAYYLSILCDNEEK